MNQLTIVLLKEVFQKLTTGAQLNDPNQNSEIIFGENNNYHQIGNAYLDFDIRVRNPAGNFSDASNIRLINDAFAYCFKEAILSTTGGTELEYSKYLGQKSTIMRLLTSKGGDLSSCFDKKGENALNDNIVLKRILFNNYATYVIKGNIKGHLPLEHVFGFCKTFKKISKNLGFLLTFKTADLQDIIITTIATDFNVTINSLSLFVPVLIPNTETQVMLNESNQNTYTITYDSRHTERKLSTDGNELQVDIGSAQHVNSPK